MNLYKNIKFASIIALGTALLGCNAEDEFQGYEFAPNMYHSVPYEPLSQIVDEDAGELAEFLREVEDGHGEYYNSNPLNPHRMTMRVPPANTVPRGDLLPYRVHKDSLAWAAENVKNPLTGDTEAFLDEGEILYTRFCQHCHGENGEGDGAVGLPPADEPDGVPPFAGIANLQGAAYKNISEGHIFHVITHGKGLMWAHGSQIDQKDRWKIAMYVKELQK